MPSTYAHYRFGKEVLERLDPDLRSVIEAHRELYDIGLHGPDILFYYDALHRNPVSQIGFSMHDRPGREFFGPARERISGVRDRGAGESYLYGFICHFALDSECHPYIEDRINQSGIAHTKIEGEFDRMLLVEDGKDPVRQSLVPHIHPTEENSEVIAAFFPNTTPDQVKAALEDMLKYNDLLVCPGWLKRHLVIRALKKSGHYVDMIGLPLNAEGASPALRPHLRRGVTGMSLKLTGTERSWVLYDVGNSAFTLMLSTIIPIYFNSIAGEELSSVDYLAYWGYAASIATVLCAVLGPFLGAVSDRRGMKIRMFSCVLAVGVIGCAALGFVNEWLVFLIVLVITRLGYSLSLVFYDSMLVDVSSPQSMHNVSALGYAWGYIGSCIPFVVCLVLILGCESFGITMGTAMTISLVIIAAWWVVFTVPLLRRYKQTHYVEGRESSLNAFRLLAATLRNARSEKKAFMFLIAFFFFIDGVYTIIEMATAYGEAIGLDTTMLLVALLVTQIVAFPCTIAFGRLAQGRNIVRLLMVCIFAYACITIYASVMDNITQFFVLAICVGVFQGGIQAMSRSYFSRIIPPEKSGEFFGLMDIFGKGASFMGTFMVSAMSQLTGSMSLGILSLVVLFIVGFLVLMVVARIPDPERHHYLEESA